jgi:hypothetical protein
MAQILDPISGTDNDPILCCYVNATSKIQVVRITNIPNWYFERVAFPGQRLVFESFPNGLLEIHTGMMASAILSDTIPCESLRIQDDNPTQAEDKKTESIREKEIDSVTANQITLDKNIMAFA